MGEVKGVDEVDVRVACRGARIRGDRRSEIEVEPKRCGLGSSSSVELNGYDSNLQGQRAIPSWVKTQKAIKHYSTAAGRIASF